MTQRLAESQTNLRVGIAIEKWTEERVLAEARRRTKELFTDNSKRVQLMLAHLLVEAGWSEEDFIDALCQDAIRRGTH